jgi:hypothetical protein
MLGKVHNPICLISYFYGLNHEKTNIQNSKLSNLTCQKSLSSEQAA